MQLKNLKASFIFKNNLILKENQRNMKINFKIGNATFTIYRHSTSRLNVTGVKSILELKNYKRKMEKYFKQPIVTVKIDNTFFSKKDNKNIDIVKLYEFLIQNYTVNNDISFNQELFPGIFIKPKDKLYPTMILFHTGSFTLMGGKSLEAIYASEKFIDSLIEKFVK